MPVAVRQPRKITIKQETLAVSGGQPNSLSTTPLSPESVALVLNGNLQEQPDDYEVSGTTVTWKNNHTTLSSGDKVVVQYHV